MPSDEEVKKRGCSGYALHGVVLGELYVAASRAMVVYGRDMNVDRFADMARKIYEEAEIDALARADGLEGDTKIL